MYFCFFILLSISLQACLGAARRNAANVVPFPSASPPPSLSNFANQSLSSELQIRLPFMDINIKTNKKFLIMQEFKTQQIFALHGRELHKLILSRQERGLPLIGILADSIRQQEPIQVEVLLWRSNLLVVTALEEYLEIYQLPTALLEQNAEASKSGRVNVNTITHFQPIQQLTLNGRFRKLFLFNVAEERVMLLTMVNYTKLHSKLRTFEWSNTFFSMVEDLTIPALHSLNVIGNTQKYLLSGRLIRHQDKTIIVVQEIDHADLHLRTRQTLTIPSHTVNAFTFRGRNYLFGCAVRQEKCNIFRMKHDEPQFSAYRQFSNKELAFDYFAAGAHFLVGVHQRAVKIYPTSRLDCYASFTANETDVSEIIPHVSQQDESFVLLNYRRPFHTLIRIVEVEVADEQRLGMPSALNDSGVEDLSLSQQHRHLFEEIVQRLRSLLLQRKSAMDVFRKAAAILRPKLQVLNASNAVRLHTGNIGIVRILGETLQSPVQLLKRVLTLGETHQINRFPRAILEKSGSVLEMPKVAKVRRLHVDSLLYNGSLLPGFHLINTSSTHLPMLSIRPAVRTKVLRTSHLLIRHSFRQPRHDTKESNKTLIKIRDLKVELINNVSVSEFINSIYLRSRDRKLKGRLILKGETKVHALWTPLLNEISVGKLFNLKVPQIVSSNLLINSITVKEMQAELVNGLNLEENVAFSGREDLIEAPVEIKYMSVADDLVVGYKPKVERNVDWMDVDSKFQQFYTGKVTINGSLTVDNLIRDNTNATVFVNGLLFSESTLREIYLLQNTEQAIHTTVKFGNAKVTSPQLSSNYLNGHPTTEHMLTTGLPPLEMPLLLIFQQAKVDGDIICETYETRLLELSTDAVRHGESANITGSKFFQAPLVVDHLTTKKLNDLPVNELVLKSQLREEFRFYGNKSFDKLVVNRNTYVEHCLNGTYFNKTPSQRDYYFKHLEMPYQLEASNIVLHKINGISLDQIFDNLSVEDEQLVLHKNLLVKGNAQFVKHLQVVKINDVWWTDYVGNLVRFNENAIVNGTTRFLQGLTVKNAIQTPLINTDNMGEIFSNVLLKSKSQRITGKYLFGSLRLTNLDVSVINDIPTDTFIDTRTKELDLHGDLVVPKLTVHGDLSGNFVSPFPFTALNKQLQQLTQRRWRNLVVLGNAYWKECLASKTAKQYELLKYLYRHAVRRSGDQVISGTVYMTQPLIGRMRTSSIFPSGVDLNYIARDCLLKNTTAPQTIIGSKLFHKSIHLQRALVAGPLRITTLNAIDVQRFHASLYRLSSGMPIGGPLYFKIPPIVGQLVVYGLVNGMPTAQIYTTSNSLLPPVKMHSLVIDNDLLLAHINGKSFDCLLNNRIKLDGEPQEVDGFLTFENLVLNNETLLQSINGIPVDNLVYKKSDHVQVISGSKVIDGSLLFNGPSHVATLNGQNLAELYKETIFTIGNYHFEQLNIDQGTFVKGLVLVGKMPMSAGERKMSAFKVHAQVKNMAEAENEVEDHAKQSEGDDSIREQLTNTVNQLSNLLSTQNATEADNRNDHLLYLDFDFNTEVLTQYANESVNETFLYDQQRVTPCEHRLLQVQSALHSPRLFITNITTSFLTAHSGTIFVKAQNYCADRYKKLKSKITVNGSKIAKVFGMKKYVESIELFAGNKNHTFLLLHAIDEARNRNEVRMLRIDDELDEIRDVQTIPFGIGKSIRLFEFGNLTVLLSAALVGNQQAVSVYHFMPSMEHFKLAQLIDGAFDVMQMVAVQSHQYQLLLSCHTCHQVNVYDLTREPINPYKLFQIIKLPIRIDKLHTFTMSDGEWFLLVLGEQQQDFYYLYKYAYIQGWLHSTFGYFPNIQLAVPLSGKLLKSHDNDLLLLLCSSGKMNRCSVVRAFMQK
ncbi:uncharacterized protein LOC129247352 isoform X1 [Anastrepha obliqua]|uniref:uncharacterized protein LOC129247352 isoform X1 n=2 Tax=Anastrepha obliqua TaxID=95512 RepID=UPI00240986C6|nr:uncharacterized protein LOC129247352 isoform X1 [Anastrepha obliqua]